MELVEGPNLATVITTRAIDFHDAVRWTIQICRAIESAHAMNVVHCDLKPANILLDDEQRIRVTDFGLARSLDQEMPGAAEIEGTARFMAPEQVSRHWGVIDRRTDVYGIGAVLLNLITGHAPFASGRNAEVLAQVVSHLPVTGLATIDTSVPDRLIEVCRKSLAKAPVDRYQTVTDLRAALECVERPSW
jgi:serine/threonine protein kinase